MRAIDYLSLLRTRGNLSAKSVVSFKKLESQQNKQLEHRYQKIRNHKIGVFRTWLMWHVDPISSESLSSWAAFHLGRVVNRMPRGVYKFASEAVCEGAKENLSLFEPIGGIYTYNVTYDYQISILPHLGVISFYAPSRNFKRAIDPTGSNTSWDWEFEGQQFSGDNLSQGEEEKVKLVDEALQRFQNSYEYGAGATIAIIDSGVCERSEELSDRIVATWEVQRDRVGRPHRNYGHCTDEIGHGTKTASVAAGTTCGMAPRAEVLSIKIPMSKYGNSYRYRILDFLTAIEMLLDEESPLIRGEAALEKVKTLLLPNGIYRTLRRGALNIGPAVVAALAVMHNEHDIAIVGAIGNRPKKVAFPAGDRHVFSVGCVDQSGVRWPHSGSGFDSTGSSAPKVFFNGKNVECEDLMGKRTVETGTSISAAAIAGIFCLLSTKKKSAKTRWAWIRSKLKLVVDNGEEIPVITNRALNE